MNSTQQRIKTALCVAPIIVAAFCFLPAKWFFLFLAFVAAFAAFEVITMSGIRERFVILALILLGLVPVYTKSLHLFPLCLLFATVIYIIIRCLRKDGSDKDTVNRNIMESLFVMLLGQIFVILPLSYLYLLKAFHSLFPLVLLLALWASDTTAYFLGKNFGKNLLVPKISPKKTYEGLLGAMIGPVVVMTVASRITGIGVGQSIIVGAMIGILGQIGDIFESVGKRVCQVKDSSSLIPGHGGILDRIDSFIFAAPFLYYYLTGIKSFTGFRIIT